MVVTINSSISSEETDADRRWAMPLSKKSKICMDTRKATGF